MRQVISTALVAVIVSVLTVTAVGVLAQDEPAAEQAIVPSVSNINANKVDGKHAVGAKASRAKRRGKLVATNKRGYLPSNIIKPAWSLMLGKPAAFADGQIGWGEVQNKPGGFADGVDNVGVTKVKVTTVRSDLKAIADGAYAFHEVSCPAGSVVVGGGGNTSDLAGNVHMTDSYSFAGGWIVWWENQSGSIRNLTVEAKCLSIEPAGRLEIAGKGKAVPARKRSR